MRKIWLATIHYVFDPLSNAPQFWVSLTASFLKEDKFLETTNLRKLDIDFFLYLKRSAVYKEFCQAGRPVLSSVTPVGRLSSIAPSEIYFVAINIYEHFHCGCKPNECIENASAVAPAVVDRRRFQTSGDLSNKEKLIRYPAPISSSFILRFSRAGSSDSSVTVSDPDPAPTWISISDGSLPCMY